MLSTSFLATVSDIDTDIDSLCSAVLLAYIRTYAPTSKSNALYIPLSNLPREDLALRPELLPVLSRANLKSDDLITLSDLPPLSCSTPHLLPEKTSWILVDHNALEGVLGKLYGTRLVGCIDHHDEEGKVPKNLREEPRIVRKSGSCSSLVVEYCREAWDSLAATSTSKQAASWNAELARLALAPVLIDTTNLTSESKTTSTDTASVKYLEKWIITGEDKKYSRDEYFTELSAAKEDIGGLSLPDILRKDYKQWTEGGMNLGISSVVKSISFLIEKAGCREKFYESLEEFAKERDLSICSIMTTFHLDGVFKRELFVWALNDQGLDAATKFEADAKGTLGLAPWKGGALDGNGEHHWRRCWSQERLENSRKQVAPLLRTAIGK